MDQETKAATSISHARAAAPVYVQGRRAFFRYRDLGVAEASGGRMRAQIMSASQGMSKPTGWHTHQTEGQFLYVIRGWVDLQFEDGRSIRAEQGDTLFIPGGTRHNEIGTSEELELLEVSIPGTFGTQPCPAP